MVRRVFFALLVSGIVAQSGFAQEGTTGRGSLVGWLKSKVTGTSQPSQRKATSADVQHAVAVATGRIATPQQQTQSRQYTPEQRAAAQRAAQYRAAQYRAAQQRAAQQRAAQQRPIQQTQYRPAPTPQQRPVVAPRPMPTQQLPMPPQQMAQRPAPTQAARPQMTPQQMQQYQAQVARARQYQAAQQRMRFASSGRSVPTRTTPMTRLRPTPASTPMQSRVPVRTASNSTYVGGGMPGYGSGYSMGAYPTTSAGLYSSPRPNVPYQVGMTAITNQALYPHEFLYPHEYKAVYPPYYYKVKGKWMVTPFGVWSHENWKPMGTEVSVKYRSSISPFSGFIPPIN